MAMHKADIERLVEICRRTGRFGMLELGAKRLQVAFQLGAPNGVRGALPQGGLPLIWYYRDIEFHFDSGDEQNGRLHKIVRKQKGGEPEVLACRNTAENSSETDQ